MHAGSCLASWAFGPPLDPSGWDCGRCLCFLRRGLALLPQPALGWGPRPLPPTSAPYLQRGRTYQRQTVLAFKNTHSQAPPRSEVPEQAALAPFLGWTSATLWELEGPSAPGQETESCPGRLRGTVVFGGEVLWVLRPGRMLMLK